jgi:hypothetical protein
MPGGPIRRGPRSHAVVLYLAPMTDRFPYIAGVIEEVIDGYTVTVFLRTAPGLDGSSWPISRLTRGIIGKLARDQSIPEQDIVIDIRLFDVGPPSVPAN